MIDSNERDISMAMLFTNIGFKTKVFSCSLYEQTTK